MTCCTRGQNTTKREYEFMEAVSLLKLKYWTEWETNSSNSMLKSDKFLKDICDLFFQPSFYLISTFQNYN